MYFLTFFPSFMADCWLFWILFHPTLAPDTGLMVVWFVWLFVPFLPLSFCPEVIYPVVPLSVHLWTATAVFVIWRQIQWSDGIWWWLGGYLEAAGHGWGGIGLNFLGGNGEKRVLSQKKIKVRTNGMFRTITRGNLVKVDPGQGEMTMKQSSSLTFQSCFHFDLILISSNVSSTTKNIQKQEGFSHRSP